MFSIRFKLEHGLQQTTYGERWRYSLTQTCILQHKYTSTHTNEEIQKDTDMQTDGRTVEREQIE